MISVLEIDKSIKQAQLQSLMDRKAQLLQELADTDTKMNDLKVSLEKGYKKISELSNKELDELILTYRQDVKNLENKLIYKKSLL